MKINWFSLFDKRHPGPELMDELDSSDPILAKTIEEIAFINRYLGGNNVSLSAIKFVVDSRKIQIKSVLDIGCGNGDQLFLIYKYFRKVGINVEATGVDANNFVIKQALHKHQSNCLQLLHINVFDPDFEELRFDLAHCTLFLHHLSDNEIINLLKTLGSVAKVIVINDLHRNFIAYYSIRILTSLFSSSYMVKYDAPLSVLRGFKKKELIELFKKAELNNFRIKWKWAFRWQIIIYLK